MCEAETAKGEHGIFCARKLGSFQKLLWSHQESKGDSVKGFHWPKLWQGEHQKDNNDSIDWNTMSPWKVTGA